MMRVDASSTAKWKLGSVHKGLVGWWPLTQVWKDGSGNYLDRSGNEKAAAPVNGPTADDDWMGQANRSLYFLNTSSQHLTVSNPVSLTGARTVAFWLGNLLTTGNTILRSTAGANELYVKLVNGILSTYTGGVEFSFGGSSMYNDGWHHCVYVYDGTDEYGYVDGAILPNSRTKSLGNVTATYYVATYGAGGYLKGNLADLRVYNRALSSDEIAVLYRHYGGS